MKIKYSRLESAGNNFILLDYLDNSLPEFDKISKLIFDSRELSNSDGLLIITKSRNKDFELDFYNPDSSPSFCGNGSICAVKYYSKFYLNKNYEFYSNGVGYGADIKNNQISLVMNEINFFKEYEEGFLINSGTLHYVEFSDDLGDRFFNERVKKIRFKKKSETNPFNINLVMIKNDHIQIRTFEKGVNRETLSCGSGSIASILAVFLAFKKKYSLVKARGGNLNVDFNFNNKFFEKIRLISKPTIINSAYLSI